MMPRRLASLLFLAAPMAGAQNAPAPTGRCRLIYVADHGLVTNKLPSGQFNAFTGGNVIARCPAQNLVMRSDSLESYGDEGRILFIGHVDYKEPRLALKSDFLTYFTRDERILATQRVDARLPSGSTLTGPQVELLRAVPGVRAQQSATAIGRPTLSLVQRDSLGRPQPPVKVTGNTVYLQGDSVVSAVGSVVVVRPELTATGDSLYADAGTGLLRLMRQPKLTGTKGRPFTLAGETIDLLTKAKKLDRVLAKSAAVATSEDLVLKSDTIDLRVADDMLQRAIVWGAARAHAMSPTQSIVADSIDVSMPGQRVREMHAVRGASAEALPDTTKFHTTEKDRLTGDTIVAYFDSIPARDTTSKPRIQLLVATGNATSYQHLPPRDSTQCLPAINYVKGRSITVAFDSAKVSTVTVHDSLAPGVYVEPDSTADRSGCGTLATSPGAPAGSNLPGPPGAPSSTPPPSATPVPVPRKRP